MVPASNSAPSAKELAERIGQFFEHHPEVSREQFLLDAVERELDLLEPTAESRPEHGPAIHWLPPTEDDYRIHDWINQHLEAAEHADGHGLWWKIRHFLGGPLGGD